MKTSVIKGLFFGLLLALLVGFGGVAVSIFFPAEVAETHGARGGSKPNPMTVSKVAGNSESGLRVKMSSGNFTDHKDVVAGKEFLESIEADENTTIDDVVKQSIMKYGPSDPRIISLVDQASSFCGNEPDPRDASNPLAIDQTRLWAVKRLMSICRGFDSKSYDLEMIPVQNAGHVKSVSGVDAAVRQAYRDISTSMLKLPLLQAGAVLFEEDVFPVASVLPDAPGSYGISDLNAAWFLSVDLVLCREQGPCGGQSFQAAVFCRNYGCSPNTDLLSAYQRDLPPHIYKAVIAFTKWIESRRSTQGLSG